jgi:superfamily II DNA or RNA helicase
MAVESANTQQQSLSEMMAFRKDWRAYQFRLLNQLDRYLENKRLHLVAAPGSGKTVLGLEVIRRINKPEQRTAIKALASHFGSQIRRFRA